MYALLRPMLFKLSPSRAHAIAMSALAPLEHVALARSLFGAREKTDPRLVVRTMGLEFSHPVGLAGGFDKNGHRIRALAALGFSYLEIGTVTAEAQAPNPEPNLFRLPADRALVNRLGFPNDGAVAVAARVREAKVGIPVGLSIGKSRSVPADDLDRVVADYRRSFRAVVDVADFVVVNVSSPNTTGLRTLQEAALARRLFAALQSENEPKKPLLVKIAPDLSNDDVDAIVDAAMEEGLAGVVATNTTLGRADLRTPAAEVAAIGAGGLSGPPLFSRACEVVTRVRARLGQGPTIIGVGGIGDAHDARKMQECGADLVQLYTAFVYGGPRLVHHIVQKLV